jgi:hypothetical protein
MKAFMHLASIHLHPVKSCRGFAVARAIVEREGLRDDRRWMLVDPDGRFVTQREFPALTQVLTALDGDGIVLSRVGLPSLRLPRRLADGPRLEVEVWRHRGPAIAFEAGRAWFERAVGRALLPVCQAPDAPRAVNPARAQEGDVVSFADGYPLLLAGDGSLADLNDRIQARGGEPVEMERFRPNVVVADAPRWSEETWAAVRIGRVSFRAPKGCDRCSMTTLDPATGKAGKEPLATLASFRKRDGAVWFGVNLIPDLAQGETAEIAVGDQVVPL